MIIGCTYAYYYMNQTTEGIIVGNMATVNMSLTVEQIYPTYTENMYLVPLNDAALPNALEGNNGVTNCVDSNNNLSCQVYKISIHNLGSSNLTVTSNIQLVTQDGKFLNLKWQELSSPTEVFDNASSNGMGKSILEENYLIESKSTKSYYIGIWLSETNEDELETDQGLFGGIVTVDPSDGEGLTASFGEYQPAYIEKSTTSTNLIKNGNLEYYNNTNFPNYTYGEDEYGGYLTVSGSTGGNFQSTEYIPVDTSKTYKLEVDAKSNNTESIYYIGFIEFDVDKKVITAQNVMYVPGSLTSLAKDLKDGDTTVYLEDVSGFLVDSSTPYYRRGFIFWNYVDSTGYIYPELTYSRNSYDNLFEYNNIDTENNTIQLKSAWSHGTYEKGTKLSQSSDDYTYNYCLVRGNGLTTNWKNYSASFSGINSTGSYSSQSFRSGTKYIRPLVRFNYLNISDTRLYIKNFVLKEL